MYCNENAKPFICPQYCRQDGGQFTQDMLELCKNIKESSWIQNTAVKSLDTSVVLTFDPPLSDQLKQSVSIASVVRHYETVNPCRQKL